VQGITIVGIEPMVVERWTGGSPGAGCSGPARPPEGGSACSSACCELFTAGSGVLPILIGLVAGVGFGLASAAFRYAATRGQRDFVSHSQLVARRYDVLCQPRTAERGRELLAALAMKAPLTA